MAEIANVIVGNFGKEIILTVQDASSVAIDLSGYTGINIITFRKPDSAGTQSWTLSFTTDGIDGKVEFTPLTGEIDTIGEWDGTIEFKVGATVVARTNSFIMEVLRSYI